MTNDNNIDKAEALHHLADLTKTIPHFGRDSILLGILLTILGGAGIFLPQLMSLETSIFIGSLFLVGGLFWVIHSCKYSRKDWGDWLKPVILLIAGGLMFFYPMSGIAAIGLLLAIYLLLDAFSSFSMARTLHPQKGWGWMATNGVISLVLALLFLIGWPATSLLLVGLYVGISLFFDGLALIFIGIMQKGNSKS